MNEAIRKSMVNNICQAVEKQAREHVRFAMEMPLSEQERGQVPFSELLGERLSRIVLLRESEKKTFAAIGVAIRHTRQGAWELYRQAKRLQKWHEQGEKSDPYYGLSVRARNVLWNANLMNRKQIMAAIKNRQLHPYKTVHGVGQRNYGWKTHAEVCKWLGLELQA